MDSKRFFKNLLILFAVLGLFILTGTAVSAQEYLTLEELQEKYPHGKYWNHYVEDESQTTDSLCDYADASFAETVTDYPCAYHESTSANTYVGDYSCNYFSYGYQCCGFAKWMAYEAYGARSDNWEMGTLDTVKPGDVIHYRGAGAGDYWGHWVFVTAVEGTRITVGECNWGGNCIIRWGRSFDLTSATSYDIYSAPYALGEFQDAPQVTPTVNYWISREAFGDETYYVGTGERAYFCFDLYDENSGKPLGNVVNYDYDVTLTIYMPNGDVAYSDSFYNEDSGWIYIWRNIAGTYSYSITFDNGLSGSYQGDFQMYDPENTVARVAGNTRYDTAFKVADELKAKNRVDFFSSIIVTSGTNFADALSGSYLAAMRSAPILLTHNKSVNQQVKDYILENLEPGGTVYILGGPAAVPTSMEAGLEDFNVIRLSGNTRYETNLAILREAGVRDQEILVCTGTNFADSLSASATGLPILLVNGNGKLTQAQKDFLASLSGNSLCIIGGETAVSKDLAKALEKYGAVSRLAGKNRYETSVLVAKQFFAAPSCAVLAYAMNYPDGLCGGVLAYAMDCPMILTANGKDAQAKSYVRGLDISGGIVLGGYTLISVNTVNSVYALNADSLLLASR